jgi:predicted GIY-YIG superfamily endonuclease
MGALEAHSDHPLARAIVAHVREHVVGRWPTDDRGFVYILKSADSSPHFYTGLTSDVRARLADHNTGRCPHTRYRPWQLHVTIELPDDQRALDFERYLKSGSGRAFTKRELWMTRRSDRPTRARKPASARLAPDESSEISGSKAPRFARTPYSGTSTIPA